MKKILFMAILVNFNAFAQSSWEPAGSNITYNYDKTVKTIISNWEYTGTDKRGKNFRMAGGSSKTVSCDCTGTGKCNPFSASGPLGSTSGCAGDCDKCSQKQTSIVNINGTPVLHGGYFNTDLSVHFMKSGEQYPSVFNELMNLQDYVIEHNKIIEEAFNGLPIISPKVDENGIMLAPDNHLFIGVVIFGRASLILVPTTYAKLVAGGGSATASCSCSAGNCSKKSKSAPFLGSAVWCEGDCTGVCTLTTSRSNINESINEYEIKIYSYEY
jgi:hypothetical protein